MQPKVALKVKKCLKVDLELDSNSDSAMLMIKLHRNLKQYFRPVQNMACGCPEYGL